MFGFPETKRARFKKNFLRTAIFQVVFSEDIDVELHRDAIIALFKDSLPRVNDKFSQEIKISLSKDQTPILHPLGDKKVGKGVELKSSDGQIVLSIDNSTFSYTIGGQSYTDFEDLKTSLQPLNDIYRICNVKSIKRLAIRKINIINFEAKDNPMVVLRELISLELLSNMDYFPKWEFVTQNLHSVSYQDKYDRLNLKYGLNIPPENLPNGLGQLILDFDRFKLSNILIDDTFIEAEKLNDEIFNVFSWAISENTKNILNE